MVKHLAGATQGMVNVGSDLQSDSPPQQEGMAWSVRGLVTLPVFRKQGVSFISLDILSYIWLFCNFCEIIVTSLMFCSLLSFASYLWCLTSL